MVGVNFPKYKGLSIICLRIGWAQWTHGNQPGSHMAMGRWGQEMWLSDRDLMSGVISAVTAKEVSFAVVNLVSENPGMRWNIEETKKAIGYKPEDGATAKMTIGIRLKSALRKALCLSLPCWFERTFPEW